jgi:hypothetical protein
MLVQRVGKLNWTRKAADQMGSANCMKLIDILAWAFGCHQIRLAPAYKAARQPAVAGGRSILMTGQVARRVVPCDVGRVATG